MWNIKLEAMQQAMAAVGVPIEDQARFDCRCGHEGCRTFVLYGIGRPPRHAHDPDADPHLTNVQFRPSHVGHQRQIHAVMMLASVKFDDRSIVRTVGLDQHDKLEDIPSHLFECNDGALGILFASLIANGLAEVIQPLHQRVRELNAS